MIHTTPCWPIRNKLRVGHLNINSALSKMSDIYSILDNSGTPIHTFRFTESGLSSVIPDCDTVAGLPA